MVRIENWSCISSTDPYMPPEYQTLHLKGDIYGHPNHEDGKNVVTSSVVSAEGREVHTNSGTLYVLGEPAADYVEFCKSIGKPINPAQPIKERIS